MRALREPKRSETIPAEDRCQKLRFEGSHFRHSLGRPWLILVSPAPEFDVLCPPLQKRRRIKDVAAAEDRPMDHGAKAAGRSTARPPANAGDL
jgi:hypothetical protein